ncbi:MAG: hypothetical protein ACI9TV_002598, partial [Sulfurimonas sp.]|uniref:DUF4214 domain-containing protein n=1 Tax=Sulfurimonas sp. TaxID=2022749 RepID=UPI0039E2E3DB
MKHKSLKLSLVVALALTSVTAKEVSLENKISSLYVSFFNRAADEEGLTYWNNAGLAVEASGGDSLTVLKQLSSGFASHPTFVSTYSSMGNEAFVQAIYQNSLGQPGDAQGVAYWKGLLDNGKSRSDMVAEFMELSLTLDLTPENFPALSAVELAAAVERQDLITNKVNAAISFTKTLSSLTNVVDAQNPENDGAYMASVTVLSDITVDEASVISTIGKLNSLASNDNAINIINTNWDNIIVPEVANISQTPAKEDLSGTISANKTLTADKVWRINGLVTVTNGATLTIE